MTHTHTALLLNIENLVLLTDSSNLRRIESCSLNVNPEDSPQPQLKWRIHESVEDTKLSTNKQHILSISHGVNRFT